MSYDNIENREKSGFHPVSRKCSFGKFTGRGQTETPKETGRNGQSNQKVFKNKIYTIGESLVKHIKRWNVLDNLDQGYNVYVRNIPEAKVKSMKDYMKPCAGEKKPRQQTLILRQMQNLLENQLLI